MSKKAQCIAFAAANPDMGRQELLAHFVDTIGCSRGAANTYATECRKLAEQAGGATVVAKPARPNETDEQIARRLKKRFDVIERMTVAATQGDIRSLIISGPPGLGKSHTVYEALKAYDPDGVRSTIAKGFTRATGLYLMLHKHRHEGSVLVLDDMDRVFSDDDAMMLLMGACDTTKERVLRWGAETRMTDDVGEPIDRLFTFDGTVLFITNTDFDEEIAKGNNRAERFAAMMSRSHYIECDMHTKREYLVRIKQVVAEGMLRNAKGLSARDSDMVVEYIFENADRLRELTLRMALKLADTVNAFGSEWRDFAELSCCNRR